MYAEAQMSAADAIAIGNVLNTGTSIRGDWLAGGAGNDTLIGSTSNDVLSGGGGADLLIAGAGDDNILGDTDWIPRYFEWSVSANAYFYPVYGTENPPGGGADVIYAGEGNDRAWGGIGNDVMFGEGGVDKLFGEEGNDVLLGGAGEDYLYGDSGTSSISTFGNDYLDGGKDKDVIFGGGGDDIIIGGAGNDFLYGEAGRDTYIFNRGDGNDVVYDIKAEHNIFRFGVGISEKDVTLRLGSLMLDLGGGDAVHIKNMDQNGVLTDFDRNDVFNSSPIDSFEFADGTTLTHTQLLARGFDIDGTEGDDTLVGTNTTDRITGRGGNDTLVGGQGADTMTGGSGNDFYEVDNLADVTVEAVAEGYDTVRTTVSFTLADNLEQLQAASGAASINLTGNTLGNSLFGNDGNNILTGGAGNDYLKGNGGNDVYVFNRGDGEDTIDNIDLLSDTAQPALHAAMDTLRFGVGITDTDVIASRSGDSLILKIKGSTDNIVVANYYAADVFNGTQISDYKLDRIEFTNQVVWDQTMIQTAVDRAANNHAPTVVAGLPALQARDGSQFTYTVPVGTITDPDAWDSIVYSAKMPNGDPLPAWLGFDAGTRTFSGVPGALNVGSLQVVLWGTDNYGAAAGTSVILNPESVTSWLK